MNSYNPPFNRPFVFLSAAISLDGQIATIHGDTRLSNSKDWIRVHQLRAESDAIIVGSGTIRSDDSKLTINTKIFDKKVKKHPIRIVVSSNGKIPLKARVITHRPDIPTLIATTSKCSRNQKQMLENKGCQVIECGEGPLTDLNYLLYVLRTDFNIKKLMLEGGSRLNGEMLSNQLIDEVHLAIAPVICGKGVPIFSLPRLISSFSESPFFEIITSNKIDDMIWFKMIVHYQQRQIT